MRRIIPILMLMGGCGSPGLIHTANPLDALRRRFNADRGLPRYVALFSPT